MTPALGLDRTAGDPATSSVSPTPVLVGGGWAPVRNALWRIGKAGLIVGAIVLALGAVFMLPADDLSHYASHPHPAVDYAEAVQRVERVRAAEVGFNPDCHTFLLTHGGPNDGTTLFSLTAYLLSFSSGLIGLGAAVTMTMFPVLILLVIGSLILVRRQQTD